MYVGKPILCQLRSSESLDWGNFVRTLVHPIANRASAALAVPVLLLRPYTDLDQLPLLETSLSNEVGLETLEISSVACPCQSKQNTSVRVS